jgi:cytosine permease
MDSSELPNYLSMTRPNPPDKRAPWYKNTAPTYAGIFLWFVFWSQAAGAGTNVPGGMLSQGIGVALLGVVIASLLCHFLFYLVPGILGMQTGLPLYIVGSSTYGAQGAFIMPGFLMGALQFGWLGVNAYFSSQALSPLLGGTSAAQKIIAVVWAGLGAFIGMKGIKYVARVATFLPLIPLVILIIMLAKTIGWTSSFDAKAFTTIGSRLAGGATGLSVAGVIALCFSYIIGFFATAGAAGADFGLNNRNIKDVQLGGLFGITLVAIFAAGASVIIAAGAFAQTGKYVVNTAEASFMGMICGSDNTGKIMAMLLALSAFPTACFSSFIAANSFKTTLPKIKPLISVGVGTTISILLAVTGWAGKAGDVFTVIGASFGPVCGSMFADYFLSGRKWAGPRKGWNLAGWLAWAVGFIVGMAPLVGLFDVPAAPLAAFIVGALFYAALAKVGLQSATLKIPQNT